MSELAYHVTQHSILLVISGTNGVLKSNIQEYKLKSKKKGVSNN